MFSSVHSCSETKRAEGRSWWLRGPPGPPHRLSPRWPYLADLLQPPQHEAVVADGGTEEFGHQAEADAQRQLLFEGQALGVEESPIIWGGGIKHRGCAGDALRGEGAGGCAWGRMGSPPSAPQL